MTIPEILKELELYTGRFPLQAMQAAVEQREAITPELLRILEAVAENPVEFAKRRDYMAPLFSVYLLAQFRETRAYPTIVRICSAPGETPFDLLGDVVTEGLKRILASVFDGNPALLKGMVESEDVNEYVRAAALETFLCLEHSGQMTRDAVLEYFRSLFQGKLPRTHSFAWDGFICAVAELPAPELLDEVRRAYDEGLVDPGVADLEGIERDINAPPAWLNDQKKLITDAIAELEGWSSFHPDPARPKRAARLDFPRESCRGIAPAAGDHAASKPIVREAKVGRNDACPCGSEKKYKKCCGK